jgi:hypothetical protein
LINVISRFHKPQIDHFLQLSRELNRVSKGRAIAIIDIGSGSAHYWQKGPLFDFLSSTKSKLTLLDANPDSRDEVSSNGPKIKKIVGEAPFALTKIEENYVDVALALDVIEHLSKEDGYKLLYEMERISRHSVIIFTPNGFVWQPPSQNNEFNAHISGLTPKEFQQLGWDKISGHVGPKMYFGPYAELSHRRFLLFYKIFRRLINIIVVYKPKYAISFLAVLQHKLPRNVIQQL